MLKAPNQVWLMNFMSDGQRDGGTIQTFNIIGHYNHEGLGIEVDFSLPAPRVISVLDQIIEWRGKPAASRCINGAVYISRTLVACAMGQQASDYADLYPAG